MSYSKRKSFFFAKTISSTGQTSMDCWVSNGFWPRASLLRRPSRRKPNEGRNISALRANHRADTTGRAGGAGKGWGGVVWDDGDYRRDLRCITSYDSYNA